MAKFNSDICQKCGEYDEECICRPPEPPVRSRELLDALEAVLLFYTVGQWDQAAKTRWWNLTQTNEATTRNLCDTVRLALGRLPSCFGDLKGKLPNELPKDMPLSHEQRNALERLASNAGNQGRRNPESQTETAV